MPLALKAQVSQLRVESGSPDAACSEARDGERGASSETRPLACTCSLQTASARQQLLAELGVGGLQGSVVASGSAC